ncbi:MAG: DUF2235 domain-containing protein [Rhodobacteraceae bacterium]|nr:DUF2235 domain-containing protein [Paracoccaceae bacterium]
MTLEIGVFFDGTGNNTANAQAGGGGGSFANARSNVSLLYSLYKSRQEHHIRNSCGGYARKFGRIYKQGIGTRDGWSDAWSVTGAGLGMGATGVESRVYDACLDVGRMIRDLSPGVEPTEIIMDVFGFSRGAAAARYFVNCFRQGFIMYDQYFVNRRRAAVPRGRRVRFRFVGIFDTVAAVGWGDDDDNGPVNVHLSTAQAEKIFHLTAADEYRKNFRLNHNLDRTSRVGNAALLSGSGGEARELPGAHSDVGGGYRDAGDTVDIGPSRVRTYNSRAEAQAARDRLTAPSRGEDAAFFLREGWINGTETDGGVRHVASPVRLIEHYSAGGEPVSIYQFASTPQLHRPWVQIGLSRVALKIMYDKARAQQVPFLALPTGGQYEIPAGLRPVAQKLIAGQTLTADEHRRTLHDFGHLSANAGSIGMEADRNYVRVIYANQPGQAR